MFPTRGISVTPWQALTGAPASTIGKAFIKIVTVSFAEVGQVVEPLPTNVKVTVPEAPGLGTISGFKVFSDPAAIVAGPEIDQFQTPSPLVISASLIV